MSTWSNVAGWGTMIGGVALAVGSGGALAPVGGAMIGAGANMLASGAQRDAVEDAAASQTLANQRAVAGLTTAQRNAEAAYAPYTQGGAAAMGALYDYMGLPRQAAVTAPSSGVPPGGIGPAAGSPGSRKPSATAEMTGRYAIPRDPALMPLPTTLAEREAHRDPGAMPATTPEARASKQTASSYVPLGQTNAGMVQMRAPDGTTQWVPRASAPFYASRGAVEMT